MRLLRSSLAQHLFEPRLRRIWFNVNVAMKLGDLNPPRAITVGSKLLLGKITITLISSIMITNTATDYGRTLRWLIVPAY